MKQHIENLIAYEIKQGIIHKRDYTYVKNQLYYLLKQDFNSDNLTPQPIHHPSDALNPILDALITAGKLNDSIIDRDLFDAKIMNIFASLPSVIESKFYTLHQSSKTAATDYLYNYAKSLNYIRYDRILKNKTFTYQSGDMKLQITINLSKPEKDPKDIIAATKAQTSNYPLCVLCKENEGFSGNKKRDSRDQHRLIKLDLNNQPWYFQYSPYIYYNEHAIVLSDKHKPMHITKSTFKNLLTLVDQFEGYFFGSNADLPIVGGSILSHDHYQGGKHKFPIEDAKVLQKWQIKDVSLAALDWPLSTIRLKSKSKSKMIDLADNILTIWKTYDNEPLDIISQTNKTPHNTITPVARFKENYYELDLILRNNRTSAAHPLGIFHPHSDKHHIKKENIGLIEAIGLAILPARLLQSITALKNYHFNQVHLDASSMIHKAWFDNFVQNYQITPDNFDTIIEFEIGKVFEAVLNDCGVFKQKDQLLFIQFIEDYIYEKHTY